MIQVHTPSKGATDANTVAKKTNVHLERYFLSDNSVHVPGIGIAGIDHHRPALQKQYIQIPPPLNELLFLFSFIPDKRLVKYLYFTWAAGSEISHDNHTLSLLALLLFFHFNRKCFVTTDQIDHNLLLTFVASCRKDK